MITALTLKKTALTGKDKINCKS